MTHTTKVGTTAQHYVATATDGDTSTAPQRVTFSYLAQWEVDNLAKQQDRSPYWRAVYDESPADLQWVDNHGRWFRIFRWQAARDLGLV